MRRNYTGSIVFTLLFALAAIWFLYPTVDLYSKDTEQRDIMIEENPDLRSKIVNLGLDLQGGMRLVLKVDTVGLTEEAKEGILDRAYLVLENRINSLGLTEPSIQLLEHKYQIIVELPGLNDQTTAEDIIGSRAKLNFHTLRDAADVNAVVNAVDAALRGEIAREELNDTVSTSTDDTISTDTAVEGSAVTENIFGGEDETGIDNSFLLTDDETTTEETTEEVALTFDTKLLSELVMIRGNMLFVDDSKKDITDRLLKEDNVLAAIRSASPGSEFSWSNNADTSGTWQLYLLKSRVEMGGENITSASVSNQTGDFTQSGMGVSISFDNVGARDFSNTTRRNVGKQLAIVLDGRVYSAPNINERIPSGNAQITGTFSRADAERLALVLQAGALPADMSIDGSKVIGASLGQESIDTAILAASIGFGLVLIFMVIYYKGSGVLAVFALLLNVVFVLALLAAFGATLTLPGIAGLILTMGMSIDANVIIFERIKEELKLGKGIMSSIEAGYDRAFVTIMDANITTLITAFILFYIGSGPIRGFAITMMFGIIVSLFTALSFTRMVFHFVVGNSKAKKLSI